MSLVSSRILTSKLRNAEPSEDGMSDFFKFSYGCFVSGFGV